MAVPDPIARFLEGRRIAVAGVSRDSKQPANAIFRRLRDSGHDVLPVNPKAADVEGTKCYPDLGSIPEVVDGVIIATPPAASLEVVRQASERGIGRVWFHRSLGMGSVSEAAVRECEVRGIECIVGGCPLMYCEPVDIFHRCLRWWLGWRGRVPR